MISADVLKYAEYWREFLNDVDRYKDKDELSEKEVANIKTDGNVVLLRKAISECRRIQFACNCGAYMELKREGYSTDEICMLMRVNPITLRAWDSYINRKDE